MSCEEFQQHSLAGSRAARQVIMTDEATFLGYSKSPICFGRVETII